MHACEDLEATCDILFSISGNWCCIDNLLLRIMDFLSNSQLRFIPQNP